MKWWRHRGPKIQWLTPPFAESPRMVLQGKKERSAMQHVAIDLGSKESQVCVRSADGTVLFEKKHPTLKLDALMRTWPTSRVVLETSSEAFRIADQAKAAGHEVRVV